MAVAELNLDLTLPLAALLKEATKVPHERAETSPGAKLLLGGELPKVQYIQFLMMLWHVYDTFERALEQHSTHPTLEPTYNPTLLSRTPSLCADISYLLQVPQSTWQSHPIHLSLLTDMPVPLATYIERITTIANSSDPSALLAHSYVRYLGDLSGGQFIRRVIAKAYGLDEESGLGVEFYVFKELGGSGKKANQGDMKRIKEWFRKGMNKGGERNERVKAAVVNEANLAFELNTNLFSVIEALAAAAVTKEIGKDSTSIEDDPEEVIFETPLKMAPPTETERTYPLASVAAVIAAVCLAHFIIVVGGLTGDKGYQKLVIFERWFTSHFTGSSSAD